LQSSTGLNIKNDAKLKWAEAMTNIERMTVRRHSYNPSRIRADRRMSLMPAEIGDGANIGVFDSISPEAVVKILRLQTPVVNYLNKLETTEFDIFKVRELTEENELVTVISYLLAKEKIFDTLPIVNEKFLGFI